MILPGAREDEGGTAVERARTHSWKEVAVYNQLLQVQGLIVPRFYGKYVYQIVSKVAEESRDVHVLLLEYFNSFSLFDFAITNKLAVLTTRQKIITQILDMINIIHSHGVFHRDLAGRNFLVNYSDGDLQLRLVDFEFATLATPDTELRLLKMWREYDIADLESSLIDMGLMDESEPFEEDIFQWVQYPNEDRC